MSEYRKEEHKRTDWTNPHRPHIKAFIPVTPAYFFICVMHCNCRVDEKILRILARWGDSYGVGLDIVNDMLKENGLQVVLKKGTYNDKSKDHAIPKTCNSVKGNQTDMLDGWNAQDDLKHEALLFRMIGAACCVRALMAALKRIVC